jgi:hypothetical protein
MFFGREDDFKNIQNWIINDGPHVISLIGGRRSGKTSILWQIMAGKLHHAGEAVLCDFHNMVPRIKQDEDFPFEVGKAILENPNFQPFEADFLKEDNTSWTVRLEQLVQNCLKLIKPRKLIILCDEFEAIEELFKSQLSPNALLWIKQVLNLPVHFVITGSHEFQNEIVRRVFAPVAQIYPIYELSKQDTLALIQNPIEGNLIYKDKVPKIIYRLSGGHPFYTQYICHTLINYVNAEIKRNYVVADDLEGMIDFIVRNPTGHIQETWRSLSNPDTAPKYGRETLAALANTIRHSNEYISTSKIFKTAQNKRFEVVDKQTMYKTLAWFIKNTRLLERQSEKYRFRTDLIRHWIAYEFQTGEDIEPLVGGSVVPILTPERVGQLLGIPFNWIEKYKESCHHLKSQYPNGVPKKALKNLRDTYIYNDRISEAQAKEIEAYYIYGGSSLPARQKHRVKYLWARITEAYYIYGNRSFSAIQKPRIKYRWAGMILGIFLLGGALFLQSGNAMSRLLISTTPSDTMISFLNAKTLPQKQEVSTLQEIKLPAGKYHIEISKPGYESIRKWITLKSGEALQVEISLPLPDEKSFRASAKERAIAAQARLPSGPLRIVTGAGVYLHSSLQQRTRKTALLQIGTIVSELGKSQKKEKDWYKVKTSNGEVGWVAGEYTMSLSSEKRAQIYIEIANQKLNSAQANFGDLVDLCNFLSRVRNEVELDSAVELSLLYLLALQRSLDEMPSNQEDDPYCGRWCSEHEAEIRYDVLRGGWVVKREQFQQLHDKYSFLPIAERILQKAPK